jgi:hypothetical protein
MSPKDFFTVGLKLIGVYCLALAIEDLFHIVPYSSPLIQREVTLISSQWLALIIPAVLMLLGLYFIKDGSYVLDFVLRDDAGDQPVSGDFFTTGIKLYGSYLIVSSISPCLWIVINVAVLFFAPSYLSTDSELNNIKSNLVPCVTTIGLAIYCLLRSKSITHLAFR